MKKENRLVVVGDIHDNSIWGLARPGFQPSINSVVPETTLRIWLWEKWLDFCEFANRKPITHIVYNGDLVDGYNEKASGVGSWSASKKDWILTFMDLEKELSGTRNIQKFVTGGSRYHEGWSRGLNIQDEIATELNCGFNLDYDCWIQGHLIKIRHQSGRGSVVNPDLMIKNELKYMERAFRQGKCLKADMMIFNHLHIYNRWEDEGFVGIINGCWQGTTDFQARNSGFCVPSIGGLIVDFEDGDIQPHFRKYSLPLEITSSLDQSEITEVLKRQEEDMMANFNKTIPLPPIDTKSTLRKNKEAGLFRDLNKSKLKGKKEALRVK